MKSLFIEACMWSLHITFIAEKIKVIYASRRGNTDLNMNADELVRWGSLRSWVYREKTRTSVENVLSHNPTTYLYIYILYCNVKLICRDQ